MLHLALVPLCNRYDTIFEMSFILEIYLKFTSYNLGQSRTVL